MSKGKSLDTLAFLVECWHEERNLVEGSTPQQQFVKLMEEVGELASSLARGKDVKDDIGDILVVLILIALQKNTNLYHCLSQAYEDIRHRKGKMVNGIFIKEEDLT